MANIPKPIKMNTIVKNISPIRYLPDLKKLLIGLVIISTGAKLTGGINIGPSNSFGMVKG
jgi:hypothetical protein